MDVTAFLEPRIAPKAVFDRLPERRSRVRFMVPTPDGDWSAVTWGAFANQIRNIALFLETEGLHAGDRAAIFSGNRVEWISAALAIQAVGGVMVPVYPSNTAEQAAYVVNHSDAKFVFVDSAPLLARLFESWDALTLVQRIVLLDDTLDLGKVVADLRARGKPVPPDAELERRLVRLSKAYARGEERHREQPGLFEARMNEVSLHQPGVMLYTSGTSGHPKGVPLSHRNIISNGNDWLAVNAPLLEPNMVDLLWLPMSHIFGFGEACLGNTLGFTSYLCDPASVLTRLPEVRPSVLMSVPSVWDKLAQAALGEPTSERRVEKLRKVTGGALKFCLSGGAGLKREVKELFHAAGLLIIEGYGLTEASPTLTMNRPDAFRFDSVGKPFPSVQLKLADDGEILARGPNVFSGYHKDPNATRDIFTDDGWLKTGDVGRWTEDGFLQIIDRKKDILVTSGGKNVAPANLEVRFADDPLIAHVVVYGDGEKFLVAGVWLNEQAVADQLASAGVGGADVAAAQHALVQERVDRVNGQVASYESIKKFTIMTTPLTVAGGLLTATLKVRRKKVYETFKSSFEAMYR